MRRKQVPPRAATALHLKLIENTSSTMTVARAILRGAAVATAAKMLQDLSLQAVMTSSLLFRYRKLRDLHLPYLLPKRRCHRALLIGTACAFLSAVGAFVEPLHPQRTHRNVRIGGGVGTCQAGVEAVVEEAVTAWQSASARVLWMLSVTLRSSKAGGLAEAVPSPTTMSSFCAHLQPQHRKPVPRR
jgi:hypothetical protein